MRVLVTGSEGYIGAVLMPMLMERGYDVVGLDTCFLTHRHFVPGLRSYPLVKKDVRDMEAADVAGFDAVIHLAALSNDPLGALNSDLTHNINYLASVRTAELAKKAGATRFLFASSCSIYGAGQTDKLDEQASFNPLTAYAKSKVNTENDLRNMASDTFSPVYLRNGTAYGLSARMRFDLVINNLTGWGYTTGKVTLLSDGTAWRPLVHIRDISMALIASLEAPRDLIHNQAFNVGVKEANYQVRSMANTVAEIVPGSTVTFAQGVEADKRNYNVSFEKIHTVLQDYFKPSWHMRDGIDEIYHACRITKLDYETFDGPLYMTVKHMKQLLSEGRVDENLRWRAAR